jgi:hypothetical protein
MQKQAERIIQYATPLMHPYATTRGDLRVAAAAFETLGHVPVMREARVAAVRWLSTSHNYDEPLDREAVIDVRACIGRNVIRILSGDPLVMLELFDDLKRALETQHLHKRNRDAGVNVCDMLRGAMPSQPFATAVMCRGAIPSRPLFMATAETWVPRALDGPAAARAFAWRVLRWLPLSEQLLALPAVAAEITSSPDAVEILAAVGAAAKPFLVRVAPALVDMLHSDTPARTPAQGRRTVQVLGLLGAWSDDGVLSLVSLLDLAYLGTEEDWRVVRYEASRLLIRLMQEEPVDTVEGLLPGLLEVGRYPEQRASLVVLACERLAPERVAAHVESAIDAVVSTDVL